jgi:hypothetical protein
VVGKRFRVSPHKGAPGRVARRDGTCLERRLARAGTLHERHVCEREFAGSAAVPGRSLARTQRPCQPQTLGFMSSSNGPSDAWSILYSASIILVKPATSSRRREGSRHQTLDRLGEGACTTEVGRVPASPARDERVQHLSGLYKRRARQSCVSSPASRANDRKIVPVPGTCVHLSLPLVSAIAADIEARQSVPSVRHRSKLAKPSVSANRISK